jgi:hypothetical protein
MAHIGVARLTKCYTSSFDSGYVARCGLDASPDFRHLLRRILAPKRGASCHFILFSLGFRHLRFCCCGCCCCNCCVCWPPWHHYCQLYIFGSIAQVWISRCFFFVLGVITSHCITPNRDVLYCEREACFPPLLSFELLASIVVSISIA